MQTEALVLSICCCSTDQAIATLQLLLSHEKLLCGYFFSTRLQTWLAFGYYHLPCDTCTQLHLSLIRRSKYNWCLINPHTFLLSLTYSACIFHLGQYDLVCHSMGSPKNIKIIIHRHLVETGFPPFMTFHGQYKRSNSGSSIFVINKFSASSVTRKKAICLRGDF